MSANRIHDVDHELIIAGAGPNGLMLACELALCGIRPVVLDPLPGPSDEPKANGLIGQVVRLLDMRGLYPRFADELVRLGYPAESTTPEPAPRYIFAGMALELARIPDNPLYGLPVPQPALVRLLADRARELGADIRWGHGLGDFSESAESVTATVTHSGGSYRTTARILVGADGGRSPVRKKLGIGFSGITAGDNIARLGHAEIPPELRGPDGGLEIPGAGHFHFGHNRIESGGMFIFAELVPGKPLVGVHEYNAAPVTPDTPMTFDELRDSARRVLGADLPIQPPAGPGPHALRRVVDQNTRLADHYRKGRVLLLGDAAHVHSAIGGPGLNLGLQDAVNLGWKLAAHLHGTAPRDLLDTYESERRPVAERVILHSLAQTALLAPGPHVTALRELFAELLEIPQVTAHIAHLLAGSDVRYDVGDTHPLAGRLVPDLVVETTAGPRRVADLLHHARPLLLDLGASVADTVRDRDDLEVVTAIGSGIDATALLIRPDGYIAWATADSTDSGLQTSLDRWFGPARPPAGIAPSTGPGPRIRPTK